MDDNNKHPAAEMAGARAALRLLRVDLHRERVARYRAEHEAASAKLNEAELSLLLAQRENRTGIEQMPTNAKAAARFFEDQEDQ